MWASAIDTILSYRLVQFILLIIAVVIVRRIIIRLNDPDMTH